MELSPRHDFMIYHQYIDKELFLTQPSRFLPQVKNAIQYSKRGGGGVHLKIAIQYSIASICSECIASSGKSFLQLRKQTFSEYEKNGNLFQKHTIITFIASQSPRSRRTSIAIVISATCTGREPSQTFKTGPWASAHRDWKQ